MERVPQDTDLSPSEDDESPFSSLNLTQQEVNQVVRESGDKQDSGDKRSTLTRSSSDKSECQNKSDVPAPNNAFAARRLDKRYKTLPAKFANEKVRNDAFRTVMIDEPFAHDLSILSLCIQ